MINKSNSCSLWTHSHWAKTIIFHLDRNVINRFHFTRGILTEISCEFVSPRIVKKHSTNNKGKKRKVLTCHDWILSSATATDSSYKRKKAPSGFLNLFSNLASRFWSASYVCTQAVCVTRFDQSECVICGVISVTAKQSVFLRIQVRA